MLSSLSSSSSSSVGYIIHTQLSFHPHAESGSNEPTKPANHLAIPAFHRIAGLSDRQTDTLTVSGIALTLTSFLWQLKASTGTK